jgi:hypothetical protein
MELGRNGSRAGSNRLNARSAEVKFEFGGAGTAGAVGGEPKSALNRGSDSALR